MGGLDEKSAARGSRKASASASVGLNGTLPTFAFTSTPVQRLLAAWCIFCFTFILASSPR